MIEYSARITSQDTPRVGGRNLFRREYFIGYISSNYKIPFDALQPRNGDNTYTLSLDYKISPEDKASSPKITCFYTGGKGIFWDTNVVRDGEWHHKEYTIKLDIDPSKYPIYGWFTDYGSPTGRTIDMVAVRNIKLERGTVATDWTPAPEDVDDRISTVNTSLVSLASTLLDPDEGEIHKLTAQQDQIISRQDQSDENALQQYAYFGEEISKSLRLSEDLSHALGGKASQEDLNKYVTNIVEATNKIQAQLCEMSVFGVSSSGYVDVKKRDSCPMPGTNIINGGMFSSPEYQSSQIRLTLRSDHDALRRQVDSLTAQLAQLQATTKITPVLNTSTRKRGSTLYPRYGDWLLTSDNEEQYISFSGLKAELGRSIYIQTRKRAYLYSNGHSFYGLPGTSTKVNRWLSNNTTYRFVRAEATSWFVTASSSPYPWT